MKKLIFLLIMLIVLPLAGCQTKYKVEYFDDFKYFLNAKRSYAPGEEVLFYYTCDVTDAYYEFSVDGVNVPATYVNGKGYVFNFIMPEHDVKLGHRVVTIESLYNVRYEAESLDELLTWPGKTIEDLKLEEYVTVLGLNVELPINDVMCDADTILDEEDHIQGLIIYVNSAKISEDEMIEILKEKIAPEYEESENEPKEGAKKHYYKDFVGENLTARIDQPEENSYYEVIIKETIKEEAAD